VASAPPMMVIYCTAQGVNAKAQFKRFLYSMKAKADIAPAN